MSQRKWCSGGKRKGAGKASVLWWNGVGRQPLPRAVAACEKALSLGRGCGWASAVSASETQAPRLVLGMIVAGGLQIS